MNDLEYLNQIAMANRPMKEQKKGIAGLLQSKIFKFAAIATALLIFIIVVGSMLGSVNGKEKNLLIQINRRMNDLQTVISTYNTKVKSAKLRGMGASLSSLMAESSRDLFAQLSQNYGYEKDEDIDTAIAEEEDKHFGDLNLTLTNAKLNGILDRIYVARMGSEIVLLMSLESEAIERTGNEEIKEIFRKSIESLSTLYEQFETYSDTTN